MFKSILITLINVIIVNKQVIASNNGRSWLYPCSQGQCLDPIDKCLQTNCIGEDQCIKCVKKESYTCKKCINEVFNKLNLVNGEFICSINDSLQENSKCKCERN
jgi:hypothetical protein